MTLWLYVLLCKFSDLCVYLQAGIDQMASLSVCLSSVLAHTHTT